MGLERGLLVSRKIGRRDGFRVEALLRRVRQIEQRRNVHGIEDPGRSWLQRRWCRRWNLRIHGLLVWARSGLFRLRLGGRLRWGVGSLGEKRIESCRLVVLRLLF